MHEFMLENIKIECLMAKTHGLRYLKVNMVKNKE